MKLKRKNIIAWSAIFIYVVAMVFFIYKINEKNRSLENKKIDILTQKEEEKYIATFNKSKIDEPDEDIVLSIQKNLEGIVNINYINKELIFEGEKNVTQIKVNIASRLNDISKLNDKLKSMDLDKSIESIEFSNKNENLYKNLYYTITFKID